MGERKRFRSPWGSDQSGRVNLRNGRRVVDGRVVRLSVRTMRILDEKVFCLCEKGASDCRLQVVKNFLKTCFVFVCCVEPADRHFEDFGHFAHQLVVGRVLAPLILIHASAGGHGIYPGQFAEFFLRKPCPQAGLFETVSKHGGPFEVLAA